MRVQRTLNETFVQLLYSDTQYGQDYYKVPVKKGEYMVEGKVAETCQAAGMEAVCSGPILNNPIYKCRYTDTSMCQVTHLMSNRKTSDYDNCNHPL